MDKSIDKLKVKVASFTTEIEEKLNPDLRTYITIEADIYETANSDNQDGTYDLIYRAKLVGSTIIKQGDSKPIISKSKRSKSQIQRNIIWSIEPSEEFYNIIEDKINNNMEAVIKFVKDL